MPTVGIPAATAEARPEGESSKATASEAAKAEPLQGLRVGCRVGFPGPDFLRQYYGVESPVEAEYLQDDPGVLLRGVGNERHGYAFRPGLLHEIYDAGERYQFAALLAKAGFLVVYNAFGFFGREVREEVSDDVVVYAAPDPLPGRSRGPPGYRTVLAPRPTPGSAGRRSRPACRRGRRVEPLPSTDCSRGPCSGRGWL